MTILQSGIAQAAAGGGGYQIARSLRFNSADSAYLSRTPASAGNRKTWTYSLWAKRSLISGTDLRFLEAGTGSGNAFWCGFNSSSQLYTQHYTGSFNFDITSSQVFRDVGAYFHFVYAVDTTQATAANRIKLYVNGVQITAFSSASYPSQNYDTLVNFTNLHTIGGQTIIGSGDFYGGYMADVRFIDGQALDPTSFGEFDANTGVWMPKTYSGTYGTNGFWLKLDDNSAATATTLGKDSSGNGNNWTPNNFSVTAGVGNDSLVDSPTNYGTDTGVGGEVRGNYCTLNPLDRGSDWTAVLNGNLDGTVQGATGHSIRSTMAVSSGKWYWEFTNVNNLSAGIIEASKKIVPASTSYWPGGGGFGAGGSYGYFANSGLKYTNETGTSYGATFTTTDVIGCALDMDNGKIYWSKNGVWQASGDPAAGTNAAFTGISGTFSPAWGYIGAGAGTLTCNFGQRPFAYTAPSGFKALCTQNLPTPAIGATSSTLASKNMNVVTYTGDGTNNRNITGVGFQPDLVWVKSRSNTYDHQLVDAVRGGGKELYSNLTNAESTLNTIPAFISDGFQVNGGTYAGTNGNGATFVGWAFKGANTTVSNTSGTITSTVSANPTAGISVVGYTGNNTAGATVGHGLGVAPKMIIVKSRGTENWGVYHASLGATTGVLLNSSAASIAAAWWNSATPTSSVFSLSSSSGITNTNAQTYIAYCFAEVAGFSKISSYTGNGSSDGAFVYCGFRPRYLILKSTGSNGWITIDAVRNSYNVSNSTLFPHASAAEDSSNTFPIIDFLSNGFKMRNAANEGNASGATYIFAAFAEAPFNYARAR